MNTRVLPFFTRERPCAITLSLWHQLCLDTYEVHPAMYPYLPGRILMHRHHHPTDP